MVQFSYGICIHSRDMSVLKGYVRNQHRPKGSIVEGYASEEAIEFCTNYLQGVKNIGIPRSWHAGRLVGIGTIGLKRLVLDREEFQLAHFIVLQHMKIIAPYINEHKRVLQRMHKNKGERWLTTKHNKTFAKWLKNKVKTSYCEEGMDEVVV